MNPMQEALSDLRDISDSLASLGYSMESTVIFAAWEELRAAPAMLAMLARVEELEEERAHLHRVLARAGDVLKEWGDTPDLVREIDALIDYNVGPSEALEPKP